MLRRIHLISLAAATVLVAGIGGGLIAAAQPQEKLPPEKQALVDFANAHQQTGDPADKSNDPGGPLIIQVDPPPRTGLLGAVQAPISGAIFTSVNMWAGWLNPTTYAQVYAGSPAENTSQGLVLVVRRQGAHGALAPEVRAELKIVPAPAVGGPLRIVRVEGQTVIVANPGGQEFRFNPASGAFE